MTRLYNLLLLLTIISLSAIPLMGQSGQTSVTGTIQDSNGTLYINSPYTVTFYDPGTSGKLPLLNGSSFQKSYSGLATNSSGVLSISLPDNNVIASTSGATGTQWTFSICTAAATYTTIFCIPPVTITITGGSQDISAAITAVAPLLPTTLSNPFIANGHYTGNNTFKNLNGIRFADQFANINAAVTDAGSTGAVLVPPTYTGVDNAQANSVPMIDFRQNAQAGISFYHGVRSMFPAQSSPSIIYPGGHDFPINTFGPADIHLTNNAVDCTSSTSVAPGTTTITVGTCAAANGGPSGTTAVLSVATGVGLLLEPGTINQEAISAANWSILSGTTLSITTSLSHTQPYTVRQQGVTILDGRGIFYNPPSGSLSYFFGTATGGQPVFYFPANTGASWPNGAIGVVTPFTGRNGVNNDLLQRSYSTASQFFWTSFANTTLMKLNDSGSLQVTGDSAFLARLAVGKAVPSYQLDVQGAALGAGFTGISVNDSNDRLLLGYSSTPLTGTKLVPAKIQFGNASIAGDLEMGSRGNVASNIVFYTSPDAGVTGLVEAGRFNSSGNLVLPKAVSIGGGTLINLYKTVTDTPGAITVNNLTCTDRAVALAGSGTGAIIGIAAAYALDANIYLSPAQAVAGTLHYRICNSSGGNITLNAAAAFNLMVLQ